MTKFETYEGVVIYRSHYGTDFAITAIKKAINLGFDSLLAVLPDGRIYDYTTLLRRDYLPQLTFLNAA